MRLESVRKRHSHRRATVSNHSKGSQKAPKDVLIGAGWRATTLNEALVEVPQGGLELSQLSASSPLLAQGFQIGVSGLALARAVQCFKGADSLEEYVEGTSSAALAAAGVASLIPHGSALAIHRGLMAVHGSTEMALGIREVIEELKKPKAAKLELAAGILDTVKGLSTFLPLFKPETSVAVNVFQIGAIVAKLVMEPFMERSKKLDLSKLPKSPEAKVPERIEPQNAKPDSKL